MAKPVTPNDMFDLWQKMVNPGAYPLQSLMFPVMDPQELEKKINELAVVEHWLRANLNMVQLTAKSLSFQMAMLKGGEAAAEVMKNPGAEAVPEAPEALSWPWSFMPQPGNEPKVSPRSTQSPRRTSRKKKTAE